MNLFQHTDGGFYERKGLSTSTVDQSTWVVYEHVWPFEVKLWHRPLAEWESRFTPVSSDVVVASMARDRALVQAEIIHKRRVRKAKEGK